MLRVRMSRLLEAIALIAAVCVIGQFVPASVFNAEPATGGDTGSHFWPVKVLHDYGLPHGVLRPWNPGNNAGEGLLVHYFPFPFIFMALVGYIIPLGQAFNLGTILPVLTLPIATWASLRIMGLTAPVTLFAPIFTAAVVLNEGHRMWGGNGLSTMAGQFAHMYALNFLLLALAYLWREMTRQIFPWRSAILFACVALSHGYVFIAVPALALVVAALNPTRTIGYRVTLVAVSGGLGAALAAWFVVPMVANNAWTTPHPMTWVFRDTLSEVFPSIFDPIVACGILATLVALYPRFKKLQTLPLRLNLFWLMSGCVYVAVFYLFRRLELVDVRAIPQIQLFWSIALAIMVGIALTHVPRYVSVVVVLVALPLLFIWETSHVSSFPNFMRYNYSGWSVKKGYGALMTLSKHLRGDLSQPRVAFEHNVEKNSVVTQRVFEMLPYFAERATTESLYLQSTIVAPMLYSFTSEISDRASCPFRQWPCMRHRLDVSEPHMNLLGVTQLILSSELSLKSADASSFLTKRFVSDPWSVYEIKRDVKMVETFTRPPITIPFEGWREVFWNWYRNYSSDSDFLITSKSAQSLPAPGVSVPQRECHPETRVDFSGIYLSTDCPGVAHYLKYAFNPAFTASGGESLFLVSPGYIGIVPNGPTVKLTFGGSPLWRWSGVVSMVSLVFLVVIVLCERRGVFQRLAVANSSHPSEIRLHETQSRWLWGLSVLAIASGYIILSVWVGSYFFWDWRKIKFGSIEVVSSTQGWGTLKANQRLDGALIKLDGVTYRKGLSTHATSEIKIKLDKPHKYLSGICGYPDDKSLGRIRCEVRTPKKVLFESPPLDSSRRAAVFKVDTEGARELTLVVRSLTGSIDYAHAVWVDLNVAD
jgi:hypothetical protein